MFTSTNPSTGEPFYPASLIEYRAKHDSNSVWARIPTSNESYDDGFTDITYAELQNAVDGMTRWLQTATGTQRGDTIAYFGPWDPRYVLMVVGACKAGYKMVFPTPLFTPEAMDRLVVQTLDCKAIVSGHSPVPPLISDFASRNRRRCLECPPLSHFLYKKYIHLPCRSYDEAANENLAIMYTSGSTSDAKPIVWTNSFAASFFRQNIMDPPEGWESMDRLCQGKSLACMLPVLHCGSMYSHLLTAPLTKSIVHYPLPNSPRHAETFLGLLSHIKVDWAIVPPAYAEYIAADPDRVALIAQKLPALAYGGGTLSDQAGKTLTQVTKLYSLFACTENGVYPILKPQGNWNPDRWRTVCFHPDAGLKLEKIGDDSYEMVFQRPIGSSLEDPALPPALKVFPQLEEWRTEDVFAPDPSEPGSWLYARRISDNITYTDGSTFNPLPFEQHVQFHPAISTVLLFGSHRPDTVMLLEPAAQYNNANQDRDQLLDLVWPCIEEANTYTNGSCIVARSRVIVTGPDRSIPRSTKGTIQRGKARLMYESELLAAL